MKTILVGIGSFGLGWYRSLKTQYPHIQVVVVDRNPRLAAQYLKPEDPFYTDFSTALDLEQPDFVINLTPPAVHTVINHLAFDRRLPVLCEKPIAEDFAEAEKIVARAEREGILFMVAENYRRNPVFRQARRLITDGALGEISAIYVQFFKEAYFEKEYLLRMPQPLLVDVTVHHLDLARYLAGCEGVRVFANSFNPLGSRYPGHAAVNILLEMEGGLMVNYAGSLAARDVETGWPGEWRIEGTSGVMRVGEKLSMTTAGHEQTFTDFSGFDRGGCLDDFLHALASRERPETDGFDYLNTQKLVYAAQQSILHGRVWDVADKTL